MFSADISPLIASSMPKIQRILVPPQACSGLLICSEYLKHQETTRRPYPVARKSPRSEINHRKVKTFPSSEGPPLKLNNSYGIYRCTYCLFTQNPGTAQHIDRSFLVFKKPTIVTSEIKLSLRLSTKSCFLQTGLPCVQFGSLLRSGENNL